VTGFKNADVAMQNLDWLYKSIF